MMNPPYGLATAFADSLPGVVAAMIVCSGVAVRSEVGVAKTYARMPSAFMFSQLTAYLPSMPGSRSLPIAGRR